MPKINLKTLAYNTIRNKIVTCQYAPGTFLNEEQLDNRALLKPDACPRCAWDVSNRKVFWKSARNAEFSFVL